jgi:hypothetical protein
MDINEMSRKQFEELPILEDFKKIKVDSIVLLPTRKHHPSGFNYYTVVACYGWEALGKCNMYDTFSIYISDGYGRVGIDCLRKSGLMRLFLPQANYMLNPSMFTIRKGE